MAKKRINPTRELRHTVMLLAGFGLETADIALVVQGEGAEKITAGDVETVFGDELRRGKAIVDAKVIESLYKKAVGNSPQAVQAAIFWLKARCNWRTVDNIEHTLPPGSNGVLVVPAVMATGEWVQAQRQANAEKKPPASTT